MYVMPPESTDTSLVLPVDEAHEMLAIELTVVMPCLNEARTVATCIAKALDFFRRADVVGEVVVADNGSTDGSQEIATAAGARVVDVPMRGYGAALLGGIDAARGRFVIMGDADDSYDFGALDGMLDELRRGADLVMGNRFEGGIDEGAMPKLHKYLGNPVLSLIGRVFFRTSIGDFHCGLRGFRRDSAQALGLQTTGMEFASELVVKSVLAGQTIREVPVHLYRDGRDRPPHLRSWRDGWRHLRFLLMFSPRWLFLIPGTVLTVVGAWCTLVLLTGTVHLGSVQFDIGTLLYSIGALLVGVQAVGFAVFTKLYAVDAGFLPTDRQTQWVMKHYRLEVGIVFGLACWAIGLGLSLASLVWWRHSDFGALNPRIQLRIVVPSVLGFVLGTMSILGSFFVSILGLSRRPVAA